ncbi:MAG: DUF6489 family protein [Inquilinaceae bacterium]
MKLSIDVDCTPQEAREFLGLPEIKPMQDAVMADLQERMRSQVASMDPETLIKTWLPAGLQGLEQMQKAFWSHLAKGDADRGGSGGKSD